MKKLAELDLSPRGETETDLMHGCCAEEFSSFGVSHGSRRRDWTEEKATLAKAEYAEAEAVLRRSKKVEMLTFLAAHGVETFGKGTKASLATRCMIVICGARYPRVFVNALPNEFACSCGHVGPVEFRGRARGPCGGCGKPGYLLTYASKARKVG